MRVHVKLGELNQSQKDAIVHVKQALNSNFLFPNNVFSREWHTFRFFESDRMFESGFVEVVRSLLAAESAHLACMVNLDRSDDFKTELIEAAFLQSQTSGHEFDDVLREGGPQSGWLFNVDRYACSSDVGAWCIYCEKSNDVAVIALRLDTDLSIFTESMRLLDAQPIRDLLDGSQSNRFPFNRMVGEWRQGLSESYVDK
ncbi:hypothetical protein QCE47_20875 [Caballeronia sp. LZ025]|uniref:hypothetical protein n=1 Tax=Caballeronia TaxID=1827195 RepID=UPI001FD2C9F5|nr:MULTISPECIES: hypothetical protein [Caballeronia]MDR5734769.1 hypothetical protein [Caballeronia sp. LZ025]